jgi:hypothetical protein
MRDVQYGVSFLNGLVTLTGENHRTALNAKLKGQLKDYESKFASLLSRQQ